MELEMDCLALRILLQNFCSYKCQFFTKVCASSRLVSQVHMIAGQNIKKKYLMCQIPIKMLTQLAIQNSSLHNLKIYSSKRYIRTSQSRPGRKLGRRKLGKQIPTFPTFPSFRFTTFRFNFQFR